MATRARKDEPAVFVTTELVKTWFVWADPTVTRFSGPELCALFANVLDALTPLWPQAPSPFHVFEAQLRSAIAGKNPNMVIGRGPPRKRGLKKDPSKARAAALEVARVLRDPRVLELRELSRKPYVIQLVAKKYAISEKTVERHHREENPDDHKVRYYIGVLKWTGTLAYTDDEIESARALAAKHNLRLPQGWPGLINGRFRTH